MPIKISYTEPLQQNEDDFIERISAEGKDEGIIIEEYDESNLSGVHPPVKRPKK